MDANSVLGTGLLLAVAGLLLTLPIVLEIQTIIRHRIQGVGEIVVTQLIINKLLLIMILATVWLARITPGVLSGWWFAALAWLTAASSVVLAVRWHRWRHG